MPKFKELLLNQRLEQILNWSFAICCALAAVGMFILTMTNIYVAVYATITLGVAAYVFCPRSNSPLWIKFILGILLVLIT